MSMICKKCNKVYDENVKFCESCGEALVDEKVNNINQVVVIGTKQCPNCKTQYNENVQFCPSCGALLGDNKGASTPDSDERHEWVLITTFGGSGSKVTEITTFGSQINVEQYKRYIIKWGRQQDSFDVKDIVRLERTKKISGNSLMMILFGAAFLMIQPIIGVIGILIGLWFIHEKIIIIHHKNGRIKIPDNVAFSDVEDFINFIKRYNPAAVKTFIE